MIEILDFYSPNCTPCGELKKELVDIINVTYINTKDEFEKAIEYNIRKAPTLVFLKDGKEFHRFSGVQTKQEILNHLEKAS